MSVSPKISIIVPVYNTEPYLRECLDSILRQTLSDVEIIVINDGSPDRSIDIIREYETRDARIVVIDKPNEGVGRARNDGLIAARGEYVAFMDSDDYYPNDTVLEKLYGVLQSTGVDIAGGGYLQLTEDGSLVPNSSCTEYGMSFSAEGLCQYKDYQYDYGYWTFVYRRELIIGNGIFFPPYGRFQDPPFFVRAMAAAGRFYRLAEPTYVYRAVSSPAKLSCVKTLDMMKGMTDNLSFSRQNGLAKLHCLTAHRLDHEVSYMLIHNLEQDRFDELLSYYIGALSKIDTQWLKQEGCPLPEPFVPELFGYMRDTTRKYERLRKRRIVQFFSKLIRWK